MPTSDLALNMAASGIVGSSCVGLLNPLDTVRIRFQSSTTTLPGGIRAFARNIILKEGVWRGLWLPGLGANMTAICLSTGFRLGMYPTIRDQITSSFGQTEKNALIMWLSGLIPGFFTYGAITPLYLVKTHMQVSAAPGRPLIYKNTLHGLYTLGKQGGLKQLYRGAPSLMGRGGMLSSGQTLGYDMTKTTLKNNDLMEDGPVLHVLASVSSAAGATLFGMPCDYLFTRYTTSKVPYRNLWDCCRTLVREDGVFQFYKGSTVFFSRCAPIFLLYFPLFEQVRRMLGMEYMS
jgi:hypothetical protein